MLCPLCRCPAYHGATVIECANKRCYHYHRYERVDLTTWETIEALWMIEHKVDHETATYIRLAIWKLAM